MRYARRAAPLLLLITTLPASAILPGVADGSAGGIPAPGAPHAGGVEYGAEPVHGPVLSELSVSGSVASGKLPRISLRVEEAGVNTVSAKLTVVNPTTHAPVLTVNMGWIHTRRTVLVRWAKGTTLPADAYRVSVSARDHSGQPLLHGAHTSGEASFRVNAPAVAKPPPAPTAVAVRPSPTGTPTPAETVAEGAIFPVQGTHNFGGPENRFGAPRDGYLHQGQDVLAAEGTPVVAPFAGTIVTTSYQAAGAGYYAVEHTSTGFDFMFAHCEANSLAVSSGQAVSGGQQLCKVGQTGDATAPHLHFEMWVGGWQAKGGQPIDPLPYLQAWESSA
jgi:murein DD-endopeptidase MepM/ murein hydrolase activator NlpD